MFDVGIVWETYGLAGVFIEIFLLELFNCFSLDEDCCCNPLVLLNAYSESTEESSVLSFIGLFISQIIGAYFSFHICRAFWSFGIVLDHITLFDQGWHCTSDLTVYVWLFLNYQITLNIIYILFEKRLKLIKKFVLGFNISRLRIWRISHICLPFSRAEITVYRSWSWTSGQ